MTNLETLSFLTKILPSTGWYCGARKYVRKDGANSFINHPVATLEALTKHVHTITRKKECVWMGLASYKNEIHGKGFRKQNNVALIRTLWMDIDVRPEKPDHYTTDEDALAALVAFVREMDLPLSLIVYSGYGLHVYWPLTDEYSIDEWQRYADILKILISRWGLLADNACTADAARVLRPVGTYNYKDPAQPKLVEKLLDNAVYTDEELFSKLAAAGSKYGAHIPPPAPVVTDMYAVDLSHLFGDTVEKDAEPIIKACQQIREAAFQAEPVWRGMLSVIRLCKDGEEWCHGLSAFDEARYDAGATDEKLAALNEQQSTGMPMLCETFNNLRPGICPSCPRWGKCKSPIVLGTESAPVEQVKEEFLNPSSPYRFSEKTASIRGLLKRPPPPRRFLVNTLIPANIVVGLVAPGGTGKSFLSLQLAISIACGAPFLGLYGIQSPGKVVVLSGEDDKEEFHRRLHSVVSALNLTNEQREKVEENILFIPLVGSPSQLTVKDRTGEPLRTAGSTELLESLSGIKDIRLITFDPISRFRGGSEISAEDMTAFVSVLESVRKVTGATILCVHHVTKASMGVDEPTAQAARGSSAFTDALRMQINISVFSAAEAKKYGVLGEERRNYLTLAITKSNYGAMPNPIHLHRDGNGVLRSISLCTSASTQQQRTRALLIDFIGEHPGEYSKTSLIKEHAGAEKQFGLGEKALGEVIDQLVAEGMFTIKSEGRNKTLWASSIVAPGYTADEHPAISRTNGCSTLTH